VGDLVFIALVLGVAATHRISLARVAAAAALGLAVAGALAAAFGAAVPALLPLGAAVVAVVPEARRLRREDRRTATLAVGIASAVVVGVLLSPH
jgi:fructose-specific phosphotransferase system IIC component